MKRVLISSKIQSDKTLSMAPLTSANGRKIEQVLRGQLLIEQLNDAERDILSRDLRRILQRRLPLSLVPISWYLHSCAYSGYFLVWH